MHILHSFLQSLLKHYRGKQQGPEIAMIVALDAHRGIGNHGELLYHNKIDMEYFKQQTMGYPVIMGSTTYFSIPQKWRPLSGRKNIILTRNQEKFSHEAVDALSSFTEIFDKYSQEKKIWIIGGASIYTQGIEYADTLSITQFFGKKEADTFFPEFKHEFYLASESKRFHDEKEAVDFIFQIWKRK